MVRIGKVEKIVDSGAVALASGESVQLFSPIEQLTKTAAAVRNLYFEVTVKATATATAGVSYWGTLGGIGSCYIKDVNGRIIKHFTGPQLADWYYLTHRKVLTNPALNPAASSQATGTMQFRIPVNLPQRLAPFSITMNGAPFGEIAANLASATTEVAIYQEYGPIGPLTLWDYISLKGFTAGQENDITNQLPAALQLDSWAFRFNLDSDLTSIYLSADGQNIFENLDAQYFEQAWFDNEQNVYSQAVDNRPAGLFPMPFAPFARGTADKLQVTLSAVNNNSDPVNAVSQGSQFYPLALYYTQKLA
jgi:hypothetical protein